MFYRADFEILVVFCEELLPVNQSLHKQDRFRGSVEQATLRVREIRRERWDLKGGIWDVPSVPFKLRPKE